ncbi:MAG: hypothetical protein AAF404_11355, partial [Pseudomonadota bacterium]
MTELNVLWQPSSLQIDNANITRFRHSINNNHSLELSDYWALHQWSVNELDSFWSSVWDFC